MSKATGEQEPLIGRAIPTVGQDARRLQLSQLPKVELPPLLIERGRALLEIIEAERVRVRNACIGRRSDCIPYTKAADGTTVRPPGSEDPCPTATCVLDQYQVRANRFIEWATTGEWNGESEASTMRPILPLELVMQIQRAERMPTEIRAQMDGLIAAAIATANGATAFQRALHFVLSPQFIAIAIMIILVVIIIVVSVSIVQRKKSKESFTRWSR